MDAFAAVCERVASYSSRLQKVRLIAGYLRVLDDNDLLRAVHFLAYGPVVHAPAYTNLFGEQEVRKISVGYATLRDAYMAVTGWDALIIGRCHEEVGDTGETIGLLLPGHTQDFPMTLADAESVYTELYQARRAVDKVAALQRALFTYSPLAIKYFIKIMTGSLRIGLQAKMVEEAVAQAMDTPIEDVRRANNRLGDLAQVALAARHGRVQSIEARLFHPLDFMLAKPLDTLTDLADPDNYIVEDKYDGIRSQVHAADGRVVIYTRGMGEVTGAFPEIAEAMQQLPGSVALDGEILGWRDGRALPFTLLQQRIARKRVSAGMLREIPAVFMGYDVLYRDGELLVDRPVEERRAALERTLGNDDPRLLIAPQFAAATTEEVDSLFEGARTRGNEGLVLKRRGSLYESGRRTGTWWKVKRPFATLDVVITAAEQGNGKRATVLSDYTFGVRSDGRYLNIGKAYSGLTDEEIRELTRILRAAVTERYGRALLVRPQIVLEVAFDSIQKSSRHKSGYALRFPRIVRWRRDKKPEDADNLERVKELYESLWGGT